MKKIILLCMGFLCCCSLKAQEADSVYLSNRANPQWFSNAKLGIFIHFGLYSVPSWSGKTQYAEWFYKGLISQDTARIEFQQRVFGKDFQYTQYPELFKAELFDADQWADIIASSGAKYVLFTSKHHDGYCLYPSAYAPNWNSVAREPKRDFCAELSRAVKQKNIIWGLYYSLNEWTNPLYRWTIDTTKSIKDYVDKHMTPQFKELVNLYHPKIIFSDGDWDNSAKEYNSNALVAWYYKNEGDSAIVNNRWGNGFKFGYLTPEYTNGINDTIHPWAECRGIGRSFGFNRNEDLSSYMTSDQIIEHLTKLVSHGGGLTLNIGPSADGQIPLLQQERLMELGEWLKLNGDGIYDTKGTLITDSNFYYTQKGNSLYVFFTLQKGDKITIPLYSFGKLKVKKVCLLENNISVKFKHKKDCIVVENTNLHPPYLSNFKLHCLKIIF